jgi:hypothetical protein
MSVATHLFMSAATPTTQYPPKIHVTALTPPTMKIAKRSLLVYLTVFLALFVNILLWKNPAKEYLTDWMSYVFPLFVIAAGLLLGWFGLMIIQQLRWVRSFYLLGLNFCGIVVLVFILFVHGQSIYRGWYVTSHPAARYHFDDHGELKGSDLTRGLEELYAYFPDPHQFHYRGFLFTCRPAAGPGYDTTWTVYYIYQLYPDTSTTRHALVEINRGRIHILSGNQPPGYDSTYRRLVQEYNKDRKNKIAMLIETMNSVRHDPRMDSDNAAARQIIQNALRDTIP